MKTWLKVSHHRHSGRLRPHEHTSYAPLLFLLIAVGLALTIGTATAQSPPPQSGSVGLTGGMPGPAPTVAAVINSPSNGQRFSTTPVAVTGTCPKNTLVEVFKNEIFAGSGLCSDSGTFSFEIDLLIGQNILIARVYDALNQPGPDSNLVTVFYDALPAQSGPLSNLSFGGSQLLLNTDAIYRGIFPDQELKMPIDILGGTPPFALNIQWGDSSNKVVARNDNVSFNVGHIYRKAGTYQITIQATDAQGRVAFMSVAAIVNGQPDPLAAATTKATTNKFLVLWPLYTSAIAVVISFWLGERREKKILTKHGIGLTA